MVAADPEPTLVGEGGSDFQPRKTCVEVVVRLRPLEASGHCRRSFLADSSDNIVASEDGQHLFQFDRVFGESHTQEDLYNDAAKPVVEDVLKGYNGTILAYGQTGSGKTYSMFGNCEKNAPSDCQGVVPRALQEIVERTQKMVGSTVICCSFFELYCEQVRDLLCVRSKPLQLKEIPRQGFYIDGLTSKSVASVDEAFKLLRTGLRNRSEASTALNAQSSRSHAVFEIGMHHFEDGDHVQHQKITFVDLAGSERLRKSASTGKLLKEAKQINSSLSALGNVINALAEGRPHVPYRNSKLTRLLEDSVGGTCRATLLVTCSPCSTHSAETLSSLRFAKRAKKVCNFVSLKKSASCASFADQRLLLRISALKMNLGLAQRQLDHSISQRGMGTSLPLSAAGWLESYPEPYSSPTKGTSSSPTKGASREDMCTDDRRKEEYYHCSYEADRLNDGLKVLNGCSSGSTLPGSSVSTQEMEEAAAVAWSLLRKRSLSEQELIMDELVAARSQRLALEEEVHMNKDLAKELEWGRRMQFDLASSFDGGSLSLSPSSPSSVSRCPASPAATLRQCGEPRIVCWRVSPAVAVSRLPTPLRSCRG